jgi:hypothetical protein
MLNMMIHKKKATTNMIAMGVAMMMEAIMMITMMGIISNILKFDTIFDQRTFQTGT